MNHVRGKLQQAYFPAFIHPLKDDAQGVLALIHLLFEALNDFFNRVVDNGLLDVCFAKLEPVLENGQVAGVVLQPIHKLLGAFAETIQKHPLQVSGRDDLRSFSVQTPVANTHFVGRIHQLGD